LPLDAVADYSVALLAPRMADEAITVRRLDEAMATVARHYESVAQCRAAGRVAALFSQECLP
jgi:hypothetical protein